MKRTLRTAAIAVWALLGMAGATVAAPAAAPPPTYAECLQHWQRASNPLQTAVTGDTTLHRLYQIGNYTPDGAVLHPADYDRVFGRGAAAKMANFGIEAIERQGNRITLTLQNQIKDGDARSWVTIGEPAPGGMGYKVSFTVTKVGAETHLEDVAGMYGHGPAPVFGFTVDSRVNSFTLTALEGGYMYAYMDTKFGDSELCGRASGGVAHK